MKQQLLQTKTRSRGMVSMKMWTPSFGLTWWRILRLSRSLPTIILCRDTAGIGKKSLTPSPIYTDSLSSRKNLLLERREENKNTTMKIVFTPMHGVGKVWAARSFEAFSLPPYIPVPEQIEPDPDFPTVPFPNPEEGKGIFSLHALFEKRVADLLYHSPPLPYKQGALKLAIETAEKEGSSLILAHDPDSDRLAAAEKLKR